MSEEDIDLELEKLIEKLNIANRGHINPDYGVSYYKLDKNYPILYLKRRTWVPVELFIFALSTDSREIPLLVKTGQSLAPYRLNQLADAVVRNRVEANVCFKSIVELFYIFTEQFSDCSLLPGGFLRKVPGARLDLLIEPEIILKNDSIPVSQLPSTTNLPQKIRIIPTQIEKLELVDTVLTVGTKSDHEILRARGFNEIYQFNQVYLGIKNSGGKKTFGIFIALNQFDNVVLLLPISEIFMQIQDNIAGLIFSSGIYIAEQYNRLRLATLYSRILSNCNVCFLHGINFWQQIERAEFLECVAFDKNFNLISDEYVKFLFDRKFRLTDKNFWIDEFKKRGLI